MRGGSGARTARKADADRDPRRPRQHVVFVIVYVMDDRARRPAAATRAVSELSRRMCVCPGSASGDGLGCPAGTRALALTAAGRHPGQAPATPPPPTGAGAGAAASALTLAGRRRGTSDEARGSTSRPLDGGFAFGCKTSVEMRRTDACEVRHKTHNHARSSRSRTRSRRGTLPRVPDTGHSSGSKPFDTLHLQLGLRRL